MAEKEVKKTYKKPKLKKIGTVAELTRTFSKGTGSDGGAFPNSKMMCISQPPHTEEHRVLVSDRVGQESFYTCLKELLKPGAVVLRELPAAGQRPGRAVAGHVDRGLPRL